jgi:hypothetical protein
VEVGAGTGVVGTCVGTGVATGAGAGVVRTEGAATLPVVGFTAGLRSGCEGGAVAKLSATWRARISSAASTPSAASVSASSENDPASDAGDGGAGSLPFLDATGGGIGGGCTGLLEEG